LNKGVHIIDNINPSNPRPVAFINIPGNIDIAVKGTTLFADMYSDLVVVDITDPLNAKFEKNIPDVFPERNYGSMINDTSYMIIGWEEKDTIMNLGQDNVYYPYAYLASSFADASSQTKNTFVPGLAGSMARFSIVNDYLYTINNSMLQSFDISDPKDPETKGSTTVGWNIETMYPFAGKLFIGSSTGMFIYEINDPAHPQQAGTFSHARACDPVIADGNYAFVTLRSGTVCNSTSNQLDVVDISNINSPVLVKTYSMTNPGGLSKDGNTLFICDGSEGLKVYDASKVNELKLIGHINDIVTYDAIAWNNNLLVVANDGLYQYDYSNNTALKQVSVLRVHKK
jgi:hypothetical protein